MGARWILFASYILFFIALPFAILFGKVGILIGVTLFAIFMGALRYRGMEKISARLKTIPLPSALSPVLYHVLRENCRRRGLTSVPRLELIPSPSLNCAAFGFSKKNVRIALTQGLIDKLSRDELAYVLALEVEWISRGEILCQSWLSQFLASMDGVLTTPAPKGEKTMRRKAFPFRAALRQAVVLPLALFPFLVLRGGMGRKGSHKATAKEKSFGVSIALFEALRKIEASAVREPLPALFSVRHLFLHVPRSRDVLVRLLMSDEETNLAERLRLVPGLSLSNAH